MSAQLGTIFEHRRFTITAVVYTTTPLMDAARDKPNLPNAPFFGGQAFDQFLELRMFVVVTIFCLIVLIAQLLGAPVFPVLSLIATAWLILVGIVLAIYISGYTIYIFSKEQDKHRAPLGPTPKKANRAR